MKLIERIKAWFVREFDVPTKPRGPHQFSVGDKVRTTNGGYSFGPQEGVITKRLYGGAAYAVRLPCAERPTDSGGEGWTYFPDELTPAEVSEPTEPGEPSPFNVGDKVLTRGQYSFGPQVGIVSKVYAPGIFAVRLPHCQSGPVDFPGRAGWTFAASELTPIL